jgi:hypothetical protein
MIESTTKKATEKKAPKKTVVKKAVAPKAIKPQATKVTKAKSPAKPKGKALTAKKAAADGKMVVTAKGKPRLCMAEELLPSPVGYDDPYELDEAYKRGVYRTREGWFDMRTMTQLDSHKVGWLEKEKVRGIDASLPR